MHRAPVQDEMQGQERGHPLPTPVGENHPLDQLRLLSPHQEKGKLFKRQKLVQVHEQPNAMDPGSV